MKRGVPNLLTRIKNLFFSPPPDSHPKEPTPLSTGRREDEVFPDTFYRDPNQPKK